jgi:hypothetical protein
MMFTSPTEDSEDDDNVPPALVNFFVIGVQKGGTTALDSYLRQHPAIQMAFVKEVHHFDDESQDWSRPGHNRLHRQFDWRAQGVLRGEATPIYIYWPNSLLRLRAYNSMARLIVGLRHPSFRALSHWRMETARSAESLAFLDAISDIGRRRVRESAGGVHRVYSYIERGFYAPQITRLLALFPRDQIHFFRTDELWIQPGKVLKRILDFLQVDNGILPAAEREYIVPMNAHNLAEMTDEIRTRLDVLYRDDIRLTGEIVNLDLLDWLGSEYREPMAPEV